MPEHVLIWLLESILKFKDRAGSWLMIQNPSSLPFCGQCANFLVPDCWCTGEASWEIWVPPYGTCTEYIVSMEQYVLSIPYFEQRGSTRYIPHPPDPEHEWRSSRHSPTTLVNDRSPQHTPYTREYNQPRMHTRIRKVTCQPWLGRRQRNEDGQLSRCQGEENDDRVDPDRPGKSH